MRWCQGLAAHPASHSTGTKGSLETVGRSLDHSGGFYSLFQVRSENPNLFKSTKTYGVAPLGNQAGSFLMLHVQQVTCEWCVAGR